MYLVPQMATALVFFIYVSNEGLEQANAQFFNNGRMMSTGGRICGPELTNILELVCQGQFNRMDRNAQGVYAYPFNSQELFAGTSHAKSLMVTCYHETVTHECLFWSIIPTTHDGPIRSQDWTNNDRENYAIFPFRSRRNALAFNRKGSFRRRTRNVVDECCNKYCSFEALRSYCERK